jgi:hypothetical protein
MTQRKSSQQKNQSKSSKPIRRKPAIEVSQERQALPTSIQAILDLQGMIGNRATTRLLQRQQEEGSATVIGSASSNESAADAPSFTAGMVGDQESDEDPTESLEDEAITAVRFETQHPSLAQLGIRPKEIKGDKWGVYIGNMDYKNHPPWMKLPGAKSDAKKMNDSMKAYDYEPINHYEDKNAEEMAALFQKGVKKADPGDALLLYYAGHGVPEGMVGVDSKLNKEEEDQAEEGTGRGFKLSEPLVTEVTRYSQVMQMLEAGVAKGVHITLISDACHSGSAADLVRTKAVEKLSKSDKTKVKAATEQVKRLEDMKEQIPEGGGQAAGTSRGGTATGPVTLESAGESVAKTYWKKVVRPELKELSSYLKEAGMPITVPNLPSSFTKAGIEQPINLVINALIDLGEQLKKEEEESTLEIAP